MGKAGKTSAIAPISEEIARFAEMGLLPTLLADRSTGKSIVWASSVNAYRGESFLPEDEILVEDVTGRNSDSVCIRALKEKAEKSALTKAHAEVFTPLWVCKKMIDFIDEEWEGSWQDYVTSIRLEITCGEAPFLVSRYDASDGSRIPVGERIGILDRKLFQVSANTSTREEWVSCALQALKATYGYEYQGNNLLIARINVLCTLEEFAAEVGHMPFSQTEYEEFVNVISWNLWQMDGLKGEAPYGLVPERKQQFDIFDFMEAGKKEQAVEMQPVPALIFDWKNNKPLEFQNLSKEGAEMKFDYIIGNPPYQEEQEGGNRNFAPPIYHLFMDGAFRVAEKIELISPARFLFNAGSTPKAWNQKMLNDPHFKVLHYEADSSRVFPAQDIKGGIAITYRNSAKDYGPIRTFTAFPELTTIFRKAGCEFVEDSLSSIIYTQVRYNLEALFKDYPELKSVIGSNGKDRRFRNNAFDKVSVFSSSASKEDIKVIGIQSNKRCWKYISKQYVDFSHENLEKWKVLVPRANGSGALGEVLSTPLIGEPLIGEPLIGYTQSFIGIGSFKSKDEAQACMKYVKSKFARVLLGVLKITQDNDRGVWKYVPLQDFTSDSDIDWSKSISEIDQQLYKKYGLTKKEIAFIETHVKEMN